MNSLTSGAVGRLQRGLDVSARAGVLLGAAAVGASYQPNLLSRGTRDQAIISGAAAAAGYGWGSTAHSFLRSTADRFPTARRSYRGAIVTGLTVDAVAMAAGLAVARAVPAREHEPPRRALVRLAAQTGAAAAGAGLLSTAIDPLRYGRGRIATGLVAALAVGGASYLALQPRRQKVGAHAGTALATEDVLREVSPPVAAGLGVAVTVALVGLARGESRLSATFSRAAALALGGKPEDHRALGRAAAFGATAGPAGGPCPSSPPSCSRPVPAWRPPMRSRRTWPRSPDRRRRGSRGSSSPARAGAG